jgi:hypothetical protein
MTKLRTIDETVLDEVKKAYADCNDPRPFEVTMGIRNLNFKASEPVPRDIAIAILKESVPQGYNNFEAELLQHLPEDCIVTIAREGSVCIYVHGNPVEMPSGEMMSADECDTVEPHIVRYWWD